MSKTDSASGGLFSKVVRFVRNPTAAWAATDSSEDERESQYSKQMLKEMIERKRRNDFVRRREFDYLRKLRKRDGRAGQASAQDPTDHTSFFQSSLTSSDDRAGTIKKIDEIEAQMSMQWWRGKPGEGAPHPLAAGAAPAAGRAGVRAEAQFAPTSPPSVLPPPFAAQAATQPLFADDSLFVKDFGGVSANLDGLEVVETPPRPIDVPSSSVGPAFGGEPLAVTEKFVHDPDLEEAAILFANADYDGAAACLLDVLAQQAKDADSGRRFETWMTLFDLYRATGQQEEFDKLALEFAAEFGRSAPLWFSIPEQLGLAALASASAAVSPRRDFSWHSPATLGVQSVAALQASLGRVALPWTLVWDRLGAIEDNALPMLVQEFNRWAEQRGQIIFIGAEQLQHLLHRHTQSGDRSANPEWWRLRMAALRFMGRPDEFEMVALDYCVTYEVSPPSWQEPLCNYIDMSGSEMNTDLLATASTGDAMGASTPPVFAETMPQLVSIDGLSGHIEGDASALLCELEAQTRSGQPLRIACDRLIRMDFSAAGSVLNWAAAQQAHQREVRFENLHRLAAVFFNVVGVDAYAWVMPRKD